MIGSEDQMLSLVFLAGLLHWITVLFLVRHMKTDKRSVLWNFFLMAIGLLGVQKTYSWYVGYVGGTSQGLTLMNEGLGVVIAGLLFGGVLMIPGILKLIRRNDELLEVLEERNIIVHQFHDRIARSFRQMQIAMEIGKPMNFIIEQVAELSQLLQGFVEDLKAGVLLGNNFSIAVQTLVEDLSREGNFPILVVVDSDVTDRISHEQGSELLHILREAVKNSVEYSEAKKGKVSVKLSETDICLEVTDNGKGFEVDLVGAQGRGLGNMVDRAKKIGARLKVQSQPQKGTTVLLEIPINHEALKRTHPAKSQPELVGSGA